MKCYWMHQLKQQPLAKNVPCILAMTLGMEYLFHPKSLHSERSECSSPFKRSVPTRPSAKRSQTHTSLNLPFKTPLVGLLQSNWTSVDSASWPVSVVRVIG